MENPGATSLRRSQSLKPPRRRLTKSFRFMKIFSLKRGSSDRQSTAPVRNSIDVPPMRSSASQMYAPGRPSIGGAPDLSDAKWLHYIDDNDLSKPKPMEIRSKSLETTPQIIPEFSHLINQKPVPRPSIESTMSAFPATSLSISELAALRRSAKTPVFRIGQLESHPAFGRDGADAIKTSSVELIAEQYKQLLETRSVKDSQSVHSKRPPSPRPLSPTDTGEQQSQSSRTDSDNASKRTSSGTSHSGDPASCSPNSDAGTLVGFEEDAIYFKPVSFDPEPELSPRLQPHACDQEALVPLESIEGVTLEPKAFEKEETLQPKTFEAEGASRPRTSGSEAPKEPEHHEDTEDLDEHDVTGDFDEYDHGVAIRPKTPEPTPQHEPFDFEAAPEPIDLEAALRPISMEVAQESERLDGEPSRESENLDGGVTLKPKTFSGEVTLEPKVYEPTPTRQSKAFDLETMLQPKAFNRQETLRPRTFDGTAILQPKAFDPESARRSETFDLEIKLDPRVFETETTVQPESLNLEATLKPRAYDPATARSSENLTLEATLQPRKYDSGFAFGSEAFDLEGVLQAKTFDPHTTQDADSNDLDDVEDLRSALGPKTFDLEILREPSMCDLRATLGPKTLDPEIRLEAETVKPEVVTRRQSEGGPLSQDNLSLQMCADLLIRELTAAVAERPDRTNDAAALQVWVMIEAYERLRDQVTHMDLKEGEAGKVRAIFESWLDSLYTLHSSLTSGTKEMDSDYEEQQEEGGIRLMDY